MKPVRDGVVSRGARRTIRSAALLVLWACGDPAGTGGTASLALRPSFAPGTSLEALTLVIDSVHVEVFRPATEDLVAERTAPFSIEAEEMQLAVSIPLAQASETLAVALELRAATQALFFGFQSVVVQAGSGGGGAPADIPLSYFGPGATIAVITISPRDTSVASGDSVDFTVSAIDSTQASVPDFYVGWSTSDTMLGTINAGGRFRAAPVTPVRSGVYVRAVTPTGVADSILVLFQAPAPAEINGTVRDAATGGAIAGATVQLKAGGNATANDPSVQTTLSGSGGDYVLTGIPAGTYTLFGDAPGYLTSRVTDITLAAGEVRTIEVPLSPSFATDGRRPELDATRAAR